MAKVIYGNLDGSALRLMPGYPKKRRFGLTSWEITYLYWCDGQHAENLLPARGALVPLAGHTEILYESVISEAEAPGRVNVELTYRTEEAPAASLKTAGSIVRQVVQTWEEVSVDDARLVSSGLYTSGEIATKKGNGAVSVGVGGVEYHYTIYLSSFTWSEENLVALVGSTEDPTGMTDPTEGRWILAGRNIRDDGELIAKSEVWRYNRLGWDITATTTTTTTTGA